MSVHTLYVWSYSVCPFVLRMFVRTPYVRSCSVSPSVIRMSVCTPYVRPYSVCPLMFCLLVLTLYVRPWVNSYFGHTDILTEGRTKSSVEVALRLITKTVINFCLRLNESLMLLGEWKPFFLKDDCWVGWHREKRISGVYGGHWKPKEWAKKSLSFPIAWKKNKALVGCRCLQNTKSALRIDRRPVSCCNIWIYGLRLWRHFLDMDGIVYCLNYSHTNIKVRSHKQHVSASPCQLNFSEYFSSFW